MFRQCSCSALGDITTIPSNSSPPPPQPFMSAPLPNWTIKGRSVWWVPFGRICKNNHLHHLSVCLSPPSRPLNRVKWISYPHIYVGALNLSRRHWMLIFFIVISFWDRIDSAATVGAKNWNQTWARNVSQNVKWAASCKNYFRKTYIMLAHI